MKLLVCADDGVRGALALMRDIRVSPSATLEEIFSRVNDASDEHLAMARVAIAPNVGFVLFTPNLNVRYRLVAYVRNKYRGQRLGVALAREALHLYGVEHPKLASWVWHGSETAYRFWCNVGVLKEGGA